MLKSEPAPIADFLRILEQTESATGSTSAAFKIITDSASFQFEKLTTQQVSSFFTCCFIL